MILHAVGFRISRTSCEKCGSRNIEVVWRCEEPSVVSYECKQPHCGHITKDDRAFPRVIDGMNREFP